MHVVFAFLMLLKICLRNLISADFGYVKLVGYDHKVSNRQRVVWLFAYKQYFTRKM